MVLVVVDATLTTLASGSGAGPVTRGLGRAVWRVTGLLGRGPGSRARALAGPVALASTVAVSVAGLVLGWALLLLAVAPSGLEVAGSRPPDLGETAYFAVTTLFTLGTGDVLPVSGPARVLTSLAVINGLTLVTLAITYVLPVVTAATDRRIQAAMLSSYGSTPQEVSDALSGGGGGDQVVLAATSGIRTIAQRHLTYPVLQYFHSTTRRTAFPVAVAIFAAAVAMLDDRPGSIHPAVRTSFLAAVAELLDVTDAQVADGDGPGPGGWATSEEGEVLRGLQGLAADSGWELPRPGR